MKSYIVGNWKMNFTVGESSVYLHKLLQKMRVYRDVQVIVAPPSIALQPLSLQIDRKKVRLAGQCANPYDFGAYTGEVSMAQLRGLADYCLVGQAERRRLFGESDKRVRATVAAALRNGITPILCIGETEAEKAFGEARDVLRDQVLGGLSEVAAEDLGKVILAYTPVWAISSTTGTRLATPDEVGANIAFVRQILEGTYGEKAVAEVPVLFGGSINAMNAGAYLTIPGVNGLFVGRSSIVAEEFLGIIETAKRVRD